MALEHILGKKHHLTVRINDVARAGHHAEAVGVAVKGKAEFGIALLHRGSEVREVGGLARIGMVMRKVAVDFKVKRLDLDAQPLE